MIYSFSINYVYNRQRLYIHAYCKQGCEILRVWMSLIFSLILVIAQVLPVFAHIDAETYISVENPSELIWTGKKLIFASKGNDGIIKLFSIDPFDKSVERFGPTFAGKDEIHIVSSSGALFPELYIYANSGDKIYEISAKGDTVRVFATPSSGVNVAGLIFDNRGYWNYRLIAVTYDGEVWEIDKSGNVEHVAKIGENLIPSGIIVAPDEYGDFSGHILVSIKNENRILAISHKDHSKQELAELSGEMPRKLLYIFPNSDIYATEPEKDRIIILDRDVIQENLAQILVVTESDTDGSISLFAIKSSRAGVQVTEIASDITEVSLEGLDFVLDGELAEALKGEPEDQGFEINPLYIIFPILIAAILVTFFVLWRYRGF